MPKKKKSKNVFKGLLGIAEEGIKGTAKRMAEEEAKASPKPRKKKVGYPVPHKRHKD